MNRVAIIIPNYNMPERTDALCLSIIKQVKCQYDLYVVDNGSDKQDPSMFTNLWLKPNMQTTAAWRAGLNMATVKAVQEGFEYFAYWFLITSAEFPKGGDPLSPMAEWLENNPSAVGVHPALTEDSTTGWPHLITRGGDAPRRTWMIDNIASLYRADWFDKQWFDPRMIYAWGIDLETCWRARYEDRSLWIDERVKVKKVTNIGYTMDRMNQSADERALKAGQNMNAELERKYGRDFWRRMMQAGVKDEWK